MNYTEKTLLDWQWEVVLEALRHEQSRINEQILICSDDELEQLEDEQFKVSRALKELEVQ